MDKHRDISMQELNDIVYGTAMVIFFVVGTVALLYFGLAMGY